ncbi:DUF58 domain-containing protein [Glycomyces buryatensis]|uniref:DUF58 domain-containing protein n=1 Tax=Glycomyces buryatensis TaxID=2570927 RepID=A0A4V4HRT3_9ACTN|nr:DUF58 domain-containing protein [Glycomyces buryatensis]THV38596.1 DUF58 domain-containing protein [Glycomyces buryatensis]
MELTGRGKTLLAVSVAVGVTALAVGEGDLLRAALLAAVAPLGGLLILRWTRPSLESNRVLNPPQVEAGQPTQVRLGIQNTGRRRPPALMLEDRIPYKLGNRPRLVLERLSPGARSVVNYTINPPTRGSYELGPLTVRCSDPFGLAVAVQEFPMTTPLIVTPRIEHLTHLRLPGGAGMSSGESQAQSVAISGNDDIAIREYRIGDDLRRVHWKASAHKGELMVRREEQPWENTAAILLDVRRSAHRGEGDASSFEWMVGAAASATVRLAGDGMDPRLVSAFSEFECRQGDYGEAMRYLATVSATTGAELSRMVEKTKRHRSVTAIVAFLGHLTPEEAATLARMSRRGSDCTALLLDAARWIPRHPNAQPDQADRAMAEQHRAAAAVLVRAGWRVVPVMSGTELRRVWTRLGSWRVAA